MKYRIIIGCAAVLFMISCTPSSFEKFQKEGQKLAMELAGDLQGIETRRQLIEKEGSIKKKIDQLVDLMIEARRWQRKQAKAATIPIGDKQASDALKAEMERIYAIDGCQEIFEEWQREALNRLDAFETRLKNSL